MFPYEANAIFVRIKCRRHNKYDFVSFGPFKKKKDLIVERGIHRENFPRTSQMYSYLREYLSFTFFFFGLFFFFQP